MDPPALSPFSRPPQIHHSIAAQLPPLRSTPQIPPFQPPGLFNSTCDTCNYSQETTIFRRCRDHNLNSLVITPLGAVKSARCASRKPDFRNPPVVWNCHTDIRLGWFVVIHLFLGSVLRFDMTHTVWRVPSICCRGTSWGKELDRLVGRALVPAKTMARRVIVVVKKKSCMVSDVIWGTAKGKYWVEDWISFLELVKLLEDPFWSKTGCFVLCRKIPISQQQDAYYEVWNCDPIPCNWQKIVQSLHRVWLLHSPLAMSGFSLSHRGILCLTIQVPFQIVSTSGAFNSRPSI